VPLESFAWIGFAAFFVASLTAGMRLVMLWRRTGQLPELLIGIGVLGIGPVGFGLTTMAQLSRAGHPELARWILALALLAVCTGSFAKYVFNWRVYHPRRVLVRRIVWTAGVLLASFYAAEIFTSGFRHEYAQSPANLGRATLTIGCLLWGSGEALLYWRKMRRRLRLGLADPVVTNRFFLWGLGAGAAGLGTAIGTGAQLVTGLAPAQMPWITLSSSIHGLTAAVALWLAFVPNRAYLRFIEARARRRAEA
jgi:hypothetical protein